jgi:hypothetical protein
MKVVVEILDETGDASIFAKNLNPLRVGCMLFRMIDEITVKFGYSPSVQTMLNDKILELLTATMDTFSEPNEVRHMIEMEDYEGHNMFWYLSSFDMYDLLNCRILDRIINGMWTGPFEINASIADYSTSYMLMRDKHDIFAKEHWFQETLHEMLTLDRSHQVHLFKFEVWKMSMMLRGMLDMAFSLFIVIWFQVGLIDYAHLLLEAKKFGREIICNTPEYADALNHMQHVMDEEGNQGTHIGDLGPAHGDGHHRLLASAVVKGVCDDVTVLDADEIEYELKILKKEIIGVEHDLFRVLAISYLNLLFPINQFTEYILRSKTNRGMQEFGIDFYNEILLFFVTLWLQYDLTYKFVQDDYHQENPFLTMFHWHSERDIAAAHIVWDTMEHRYVFEWLLGVLSINTWVKLLIRMQMTELFGP